MRIAYIHLLVCWCLPFLAWGASFVKELGEKRQALARLRDDLAKHRILQENLFPLPHSKPVDVSCGFYVTEITHVNEPLQTVSYNIYSNFTWQDEDLAWMPAGYADITSVTLPSSLIWRPPIIVNNQVENLECLNSGPYVTLFADGTIEYTTNCIITAMCNFKIAYYPFEIQTCLIVMSVDSLRGKVLLRDTYVYKDDEAKDTLRFRLNGEWRLDSQMSETFSSHNLTTGVQITITFSRATMFYILCVMLPMVLSSFLSLLVFWIPPASGEKMAYLVSIYLSTAVFLTYVGEALPRNSKFPGNTPRMTQTLVFLITECVVAMVATVFVMRRHQAEVEAANQSNAHVSPLLSQADKVLVKNSDEHQVAGDDLKSESKCCILCQSMKLSSAIHHRQHASEYTLSAVKLDNIFFWMLLSACILFYSFIFII